jgi:hypothetical protein
MSLLKYCKLSNDTLSRCQRLNISIQQKFSLFIIYVPTFLSRAVKIKYNVHTAHVRTYFKMSRGI